ncbi:MAG: HU family DNA-binding protein [Acidimicrobiia bacterium]|nr:HU family DNA-binding protein [Acidimicrobiia bacterium]
MNKTDLADALSAKTEMNKSEASGVIDALFSTTGDGIITSELVKGEKVNITGFGSFTPKTRSARKGRNPATGQEMDIPAKRYAAFSAAKGLKDQIEA